jgi:hypothetical protein
MSVPAPAPDPLDAGDLPGVAICATCGLADCGGHDFEVSGERPIHRVLPWEQPGSGGFGAMFSTALATADDVELWVRASRSAEGTVASALGFALYCELVAVSTAFGPLVLGGAFGCWALTHHVELTLGVLRVGSRLAIAFIPLMLVAHVGHVAGLAMLGGKLGRSTDRSTALRGGLFQCGWDIATGPVGVLGPLLRGRLAVARRRLAGNRDLFSRGASAWLRLAHGVEAPGANRRASWWPVLGLLGLATLAVVWAISG